MSRPASHSRSGTGRALPVLSSVAPKLFWPASGRFLRDGVFRTCSSGRCSARTRVATCCSARFVQQMGTDVFWCTWCNPVSCCVSSRGVALSSTTLDTVRAFECTVTRVEACASTPRGSGSGFFGHRVEQGVQPIRVHDVGVAGLGG